ncbi:hypothetical protein IEQ34_011130 [Dendrobium chrysotoxum]|uniref:Uncharacterized protein n=1 Tax=Dendrobium chrysotoxum TaxID=161865 RepID=A0AAV7GVG7_DENCH|nr:hypothetical protein IEQ34_011130 [Dendrobium chrysotoxum]
MAAAKTTIFNTSGDFLDEFSMGFEPEPRGRNSFAQPASCTNNRDLNEHQAVPSEIQMQIIQQCWKQQVQ